MFNKILVPLDGSEVANGILPYVSMLSKSLDIPVILLSVVDPDSLDIPIDFTTLIGPWETALQRRLTETTNRINQEGVRANFMIEHGRAHEQIIHVSEREGCDLIAMSTKGRGLIEWVMLGSVTYHVVHSSPVPVLTMTPQNIDNPVPSETKISRIPVPLDGSHLAESALPYVEHLALKLSAEIVLIRVIPTGRLLPSILANLFPSNVEEAAEAEAEEYLKSVAMRLEAKGLRVSSRVVKGTPAHRILEVAQETSNDLIAMTTHGKSGMMPGVLGSVSISVLRNSNDPVLVVPPPQS